MRGPWTSQRGGEGGGDLGRFKPKPQHVASMRSTLDEEAQEQWQGMFVRFPSSRRKFESRDPSVRFPNFKIKISYWFLENVAFLSFVSFNFKTIKKSSVR